MKISNINQSNNIAFKANCTNRIKNQFENGQEYYKNDEKALAYYIDRIKEIRTIAPNVTVDSLIISNTCQELPGRPTVFLRNNTGEIKFATTKNPQSGYKQSIKTIQLATLDGITALCESLRKLG